MVSLSSRDRRGLVGPLLLWGALGLAGCPATPSDEGGDPTDAPSTDSDSEETDSPADPYVADQCEPMPELSEEGCVAGGAPEIRIGTGERAYEMLPDDTHVAMVNGPQGGWHVTTAVRVRNMPQRATLRVVLVHEASGEVMSASSTNLAFVPPEGAWACEGTAWAYNAVFDPGRVPGMGEGGEAIWEALCGEPVIMRAEVRKGDLCLAEAEKRIVVQPDPCNCGPCGAPEGFESVCEPPSSQPQPGDTCFRLSCDDTPLPGECLDTDGAGDSDSGASAE